MSSREYFLLEKIFSDVEKGGTHSAEEGQRARRARQHHHFTAARGVKSVHLDVRFRSFHADRSFEPRPRPPTAGEDATTTGGPLLDD